MSRRERRTKQRRRGRNPSANRRVRAATISGSLAATAAIGLAASAEPADAAGFDAALVKNINPSGGSDPRYFTDLGGTLFFRAEDDTHGTELWKSDGTEAGTTMVKDINLTGDSNLRELTNIAGTLFFTASDGQGVGHHGFELWKSDGTNAGTVRVTDINTNTLGTAQGSSYISGLTNLGGTLVFSAYDGPDDGIAAAPSGQELWKSDGTVGNQTLIKDINPDDSSYPFAAGGSPFTEFGGYLFFQANDGSHGTELWKTDGTNANTVLVTDINEGNLGADGSNPKLFTEFGGSLFFQAYDGPDPGTLGKTTHGIELWKTDGNVGNATLVEDINPAVGGDGYPYGFAEFGGNLFFSANDGTSGGELWKTDGTTTTTRVKDIFPGPGGGGGAYDKTVFGGSLLFAAYDGPQGGSAHGNELWTSDGTESGTTLLKDIDTDAAHNSGSSFPGQFAAFGGNLFFAADDSTHGYELWMTDGTEAGTTLVKDIDPSGGGHPSQLFALGGNLFFQADDGTNNVELWKAFVPQPPATGGGAPATTPLAPAPFNLNAAIKKCKKKFPKGPKRKKCIKKAKAKAAL